MSHHDEHLYAIVGPVFFENGAVLNATVLAIRFISGQ